MGEQFSTPSGTSRYTYSDRAVHRFTNTGSSSQNPHQIWRQTKWLAGKVPSQKKAMLDNQLAAVQEVDVLGLAPER